MAHFLQKIKQSEVLIAKHAYPERYRASGQCDQIGQFFGLWATFKSLWQQLICPNLSHS